MDDEEFDALIEWQMSGLQNKRTPVIEVNQLPRCPNCNLEWHGLPKANCLSGWKNPDTPDEPMGNSASTTGLV